jgi:hypothetical protein
VDHLKKLQSLTGSERRLLAFSIAALPVLHALLGVFGYTGLRKLLVKIIPVRKHIIASSMKNELVFARNIARLVGIAARNGLYRATCLRQALLVWAILRRKGMDGEIRFGVHLQDGALEAHAWVEWQGRVITDAPDVRRHYRPLKDEFPQTQAGL